MYKEKFNRIYFNGCSYTEGGGLTTSVVLNYVNKTELKLKPYQKAVDNIHIPNLMLAYDNKFYIPEKQYAYPNIFKKLINDKSINVINDAKSGGGAERVYRKVWNLIREADIDRVRKTLFILEIPPPGPNRLDLYSNRYKQHLVCNITLDSNSNPVAHLTENYVLKTLHIDAQSQAQLNDTVLDYFNEFIDLDVYTKKSANELLGLVSFFELNNIEYFLIGPTGFIYTALDNFFPNIDERFIKVDYNGNVYRDIFEFACSEKLRLCDEVGRTTDGHPGLSAHYIWAEKMYEYLDKKL